MSTLVALASLWLVMVVAAILQTKRAVSWYFSLHIVHRLSPTTPTHLLLNCAQLIPRQLSAGLFSFLLSGPLVVFLLLFLWSCAVFDATTPVSIRSSLSIYLSIHTMVFFYSVSPWFVLLFLGPPVPRFPVPRFPVSRCPPLKVFRIQCYAQKLPPCPTLLSLSPGRVLIAHASLFFFLSI